MSKKGGGTANKKEEVSSLYKDLAALRPSEDFDPASEDYEKAVKVRPGGYWVSSVLTILFPDL